MTAESALARIEEKLRDRLSRFERTLATDEAASFPHSVSSSTIVAFDRGQVAGTKLDLEDVQTLRSLVTPSLDSRRRTP